MTAPRQVLPGTTYLVTRRCSERRYFLRPSPKTNSIFLYVLAVAACRHGVLVHAFCVMSNHYHLLVSDPGAHLPAFMRDLDALVARATNASLGRWEGFWSSAGSYSAVAHGATEDLVRKAAYVLANPVCAGLVPHGHEWPGLRTAPEQLGSARWTAVRPNVFFREHGEMPASAELALSVPPGFRSAEEFQRVVAHATERREADARRAAQARRRGFLGRKRVLAQDPLAAPDSAEAWRQLNPQVAAGDPEERIGLLEALRGFRRSYRAALEAFRAGIRDVIFPAGTYLLRIEHGVACAVVA
jgi:putative transposase